MSRTFSSRDETRRRAYLALMGVQPYYARSIFRNAKPSPVYAAAPVEEAPLVVEATAAEVPAQREPARQPSPDSGRQPSPDSGRQPSPDSGRQPLYYRRIDATLALATADSWEGEDGAGCRKLLTDILKALGKSLDDADNKAEAAVLNLQSTQSEAGQHKLLGDLCQRDRCPNLLIFAHNANDLFPSASPSSPDFSLRIGDLALRATLTHGLREMLAFPDLKKFCWGHLQTLRARLSRSSGAPAPAQTGHSRDQ